MTDFNLASWQRGRRFSLCHTSVRFVTDHGERAQDATFQAARVALIQSKAVRALRYWMTVLSQRRRLVVDLHSPNLLYGGNLNAIRSSLGTSLLNVSTTMKTLYVLCSSDHLPIRCVRAVMGSGGGASGGGLVARPPEQPARGSWRPPSPVPSTALTDWPTLQRNAVSVRAYGTAYGGGCEPWNCRPDSGANLIGKVGIDQTTNGTTNTIAIVPCRRPRAATPVVSAARIHVFKASAGNLYSAYVTSTGAAGYFICGTTRLARAPSRQLTRSPFPRDRQRLVSTTAPALLATIQPG
jgi:hypothetical protein